MEAPASRQARASAAISEGSTGTWGFVAFEVTPFMAHSMTTGRPCSVGPFGVTPLQDIRERAASGQDSSSEREDATTARISAGSFTGVRSAGVLVGSTL